jgi:hypothetical protein
MVHSLTVNKFLSFFMCQIEINPDQSKYVLQSHCYLSTYLFQSWVNELGHSTERYRRTNEKCARTLFRPNWDSNR